MSTESSQIADGFIVDADQVIDRLKVALSVETDIELAAALDLNKSTVSTWRSRKRIPYPEAVRVALTAGETVDWLLTGRRNIKVMPGAYDANIEIDILTLALREAHESGLYDISINSEKPSTLYHRRAVLIAQKYARIRAMISEVTEQGTLNRSAFLQAMERSFDRSSPSIPTEGSKKGPQ